MVHWASLGASLTGIRGMRRGRLMISAFACRSMAQQSLNRCNAPASVSRHEAVEIFGVLALLGELQVDDQVGPPVGAAVHVHPHAAALPRRHLREVEGVLLEQLALLV